MRFSTWHKLKVLVLAHLKLLEFYSAPGIPEKFAKNIWPLLFKKPTWIDTTAQISLDTGSPIPAVIFREEARKRSVRGMKLLLLLNDFSGDSRYDKDIFFDCLRPYEYHAADQSIYLKESGITVYVHDPIWAPESVVVPSLESLFSQSKDGPFAYIIYHGQSKVQRLGPEHIHGVKGQDGVDKVRDICNVDLRFREEGKTLTRVLHTPGSLERYEASGRRKNGDPIGWKLK